MINISIIVPIYNEEKYIQDCLESIINCEYNKDKIEVLLIDGGSKDNTINIIKKYQKKYHFLKLFSNPKKIAPVAMNIGLKHAKGDFIFIISAHAKYSKDYFLRLVEYCRKLDADCVGPVLVTDIKNKNKISNAIKNVLSDKLGVGSSFRTGVKEIKEVDTVPYGCYKREVFDKIGFFDERLVRNQDIELNKRLKKAGGRIYLVPNVQSTYYARENFKDLAKNNFHNGLWNILTAYYTKSLTSLSLRHFIPMIFVLILILLLFLSIFSKFFLILFITILAIYLIIIAVRSFQIKRDTNFLYQIFAFLVLHFSYGFGSIVGFLKILKLT